jgi:hypothetical protein
MIFDCVEHVYFLCIFVQFFEMKKTKIGNLVLLHLGLYTKNRLLIQFIPHSKQEVKA